MQAILKAVFQPMLDAAPGAGSLIERMLKGFVLGALSVTIAFLKIRNVLRDSVWPIVKSGLKSFDWVLIGKAAVYSLAAGFTVFAGAVAVSAAAVYGLAKPFLLVFELMGKLVSLDWSAIGANIVQGIANGIRAGIRWITDAVAEVGKRTMQAFKGGFLIHSPSKLTENEVGIRLPQGQAIGMRKGRKYIEQEIRAQVEMVRAAGDSPGGAATSVPRVASAPSRQLPPVSVTVNLPPESAKFDASTLQRIAVEAVRDAIVGVAIELGVPT